MIRELFQQLGQFLCWVVIVAPWEQALRIRLGNRVRVLNSGIYLRLPFVDRIYRQSIRRRLSLVSPMTLTTADGKTVSVGAFIGYAISDLQKLYESLHHAEDTIEAEVSSKIAAFVVSHSFADCPPAKIESHVRSQINIERYGLKDVEFFISNFAAVKTYRFITGEFRNWMRGGAELNTNVHDQTATG